MLGTVALKDPRWKEYRYYLSSSVNTSIKVKISSIELASSTELGDFALSLSDDDDDKDDDDTDDQENENAQPHDVTNAPSTPIKRNKKEFKAFKCRGLEQWTGTISELRNSSLSELYLTGQIFADGLPMHPMVISSKVPTKCSATSIFWNEWLFFPVKYRDLSRHAVLALTIWGVGGVAVAGTTIPFFNKQGALRDGIRCLRLWPNQQADPRGVGDTGTPFEMDHEWHQHESFRLDKMRERFDRKEIMPNEWLDGVTDRRIARIRRANEPPGQNETLTAFGSYRQEACLWLEMPYFGYPILYEEEAYPQKSWTPYTSEVASSGMSAIASSSSSAPVSTPTNTAMAASSSPSPGSQLDFSSGSNTSGVDSSDGPSLIVVWDPDLNEENPAEKKYRKLARDILRGSIDPNLKPSRDEKAAIERLLAMPSDNLKHEDKDLLWKFRYTLTDNKKAVVKFLLSVDWNDETEVKQTADLLHQWCEIDLADALKLLGRQKEFKHDIVRNFAVSTLAKARNEDLVDFLLQLVQALRYEKKFDGSAGAGAGAGASASAGASPTSATGSSSTSSSPAGLKLDDGAGAYAAVVSLGYDALGPLARFLISRAASSFQLANYLYWYLNVEIGDHADGEMYRNVLQCMLAEMRKTQENRAFYDMLMAQNDFLGRLLECHSRAREEKGKKDQKEEKLRAYLKQFSWPKGLVIRFPLDPTIQLSGLVPSSAKMFKSALYPAVIQFHTVPLVETGTPTDATSLLGSTMASSGHGRSTSNNNLLATPAPDKDETTRLAREASLLRDSLSSRMLNYLGRDNREGPMYKVMIKNGDDLRQDQLIMQMFLLMDRLLKKVNLDLKLTPYRILATSSNDGLMEFVNDSCPVSYVVANFESPQILNFLRKHQPDPHGDYGVSPEALSTYVKSVAGYCVLTYLMGIGDRHLDNLMMKTQGHLFHIDFGFIFGADPKLYPPPFKLTKEMVEGMGGPESEHYLRFKTYCCQAYNWLRKSADLILNLLSLMVDAGIEELSTDPVTTLQKVQEKFRLDLSDEQAEHFFLGLINDSVTALFPVLMEYIHKVATKLR